MNIGPPGNISQERFAKVMTLALSAMKKTGWR